MAYSPASERAPLNSVYRKTALIVGVLALSALLIMVAGYFVPPPLNGNPHFIFAVYVIAPVVGLAVVMARRLMLSQASLRRIESRGTAALLIHLSKVSVICAALGESVAAIGLVGYLVTGQYDVSLRLGIIGILLILYSFPRQWEWSRTLSALDDDDQA
jgi:hypothetical protein